MTSEHQTWWSSLSNNQQELAISLHPFYKNFDTVYVIQHRTAIKEIFEYLIPANLIIENFSPKQTFKG